MNADLDLAERAARAAGDVLLSYYGKAPEGLESKTSVTDPSCRLHDVPNVYIADAAPFVSGGTQNTTWSILAMCWRTMDLLKERMRTGEL